MKKRITFIISMFITLSLNAQNIEFTFANVQTTNDGLNDFYEADVMIAAVDGQADFKLGKGQIYIKYNTTAFGTNINSAGGIEITYPEVEGYFLGKVITLPVYTTTGTGIADNSPSRISFAYQQSLSSGTMTDIVTSTPTKLFHIKMQFTDVGELPMVAFEDDETQVSNCRDQFETACGPFTPGFALADCSGANEGVVFNNANFDSGGATLSTDRNDVLNVLSVYPNPFNDILNIKLPPSFDGNTIEIDILDIRGRLIKSLIKENLDSNVTIHEISDFEDGSYLIKITNQSRRVTLKQIIKKE
jgi:hypothetical protein